MSKQLADNQDLLAMTHVGEDPEKYMKSVTPPIFMNSLHVFDTVKDYFDVDIFKDEFYYGRASNPTVAILEKKIAALPESPKNNNGISQHRVMRLFRGSCMFIKE